MGWGTITDIATVEAQGRTTHSAGPDATVEARLESLERNVALIHERISDAEKEIDKELRKLSGSLKDEEQARMSSDGTIRELLEATETGGLHISVIGAVWIFAGIVLSTAAPEIAELFK